MASMARMSILAFLFAMGAAMAANAPKEPTYVLNGYSFSGVPGVNAAEMEAKLKDHAGARITRADAAADGAILAKELEARHIGGHLFTTLAKTKGHAWIIFDLVSNDADKPMGHLESQNFEDASRVPAGVLAAATGLKTGDQLSREKLLAARRAIVALYVKSMPGRKISLKAKLRRGPGDKTILTWIIGEPK